MFPTPGSRIGKSHPAILPLTLLKRAAAQSISNSSFTLVTWDTNVQDDVGAFSAAAPTKIIVPGGYTRLRLLLYGIWAASGVGNRYQFIVKNSSVQAGAIFQFTGPAFDQNSVSIVSPWITVSPGDYFQILLWQNSGGNLGYGGAVTAGPSWFQAEWAR